jgi:hypothetical protein
MYGGPGADKFLARDRARDVIACGAGVDQVQADLVERVASDCETVTRPSRGAPPPPPTPAPGLSRETALSIGTSADVSGSWRVSVVSVTPDATAAVLAENQFNDPPAAGRQFFIARVSATYLGPGSARFDGSYRLRAVGPSAVSYSTFQDSCGVIPDPLPDPDVFSGGTVTGNVCWSVTTADAARLVMFDSPLAFNAQRYYWKLYH